MFSCDAKVLDLKSKGEIAEEVLYAATLGLISIRSLFETSKSPSVTIVGINFSVPDG